jgi:hypothetical protein
MDHPALGGTFYCPWNSQCDPASCELTVGEAEAMCLRCDAKYPWIDGVLQFVDPEALDAEKARELAGNTLSLDDDTVEHYLRKVDWNPLLKHWSSQKLAILRRYLTDLEPKSLAFLGTGTGFEVPPLLEWKGEADELLLSDLSASAMQIARVRMSQAGLPRHGNCSYFTSDLDAVPLRSTDSNLVIYECLHHTGDMHAALERMLAFGYRTISFVEPTNNWAIRALARRGLAQRIEYSGVDPDRLDIRRVRQLARAYGYRMRLQTMWELPIDYVASVGRKLHLRQEWAERLAMSLCGALSLVGRPFHFGNFTICSLVRIGGSTGN